MMTDETYTDESAGSNPPPMDPEACTVCGWTTPSVECSGCNHQLVYAPDTHNLIARAARLALAHFDECEANGKDSARAVAMCAAFHRLIAAHAAMLADQRNY